MPGGEKKRGGYAHVSVPGEPRSDLSTPLQGGPELIGQQPTAIECSLSRVTDTTGEGEGQLPTSDSDAQKEAQEKCLYQAAKIAALGQMAAEVAHEINNPLSIILGEVEYLLRVADRETISETVLQSLHSIEKYTLQAVETTETLLEFARPAENGFMTIDVNDIIDDSLVLMEKQLTLANITVTRELAPDLPRVCGNLNLLRQTLINIILNARDAMPQGGELRVTATYSPEAQVTSGRPGAIEIRMSDTGRGIPPDVLGHIFDPFFTSTPTRKGTGLGLSLVREIVNKHGGRVRVESEVDRGTTFIITLPVLQPDSAHVGESTASPEYAPDE